MPELADVRVQTLHRRQRPLRNSVVATARRPEQLDDLAAAHPGKVLALALDVTCRTEVLAVVEQATVLTGRIDVLVNNAGYGLSGGVEGAALGTCSRSPASAGWPASSGPGCTRQQCRLLLGAMAADLGPRTYRDRLDEWAAWDAVARGADFPA